MRCPGCTIADLDPNRHDEVGMVTCQCGHRAYSGYIAEADSLAARSSWLADRVTAGDPTPDPGVRRAFAIWDPPVVGATASAPTALSTSIPTPPAHKPAPSAQTLLLGVGALLLVIAGAVFAAVVWERLGAFGQVALMLTATAGVGALSIRLRTALSGTAEALAVVAAGLAVVDLIAAPMLGLLPEHWVTDPTLYPAVAIGALGAALLLLHARFGLRAWSWLGWTALLVASACVVAAVASATDSAAWAAAAITLPALTSVGMLAASEHPGRWGGQASQLRTVGVFGLLLSATATASSALSREALPGAIVTTAASALAVGLWAGAERDRANSRLLPIGAAALAGVTVALVLALPLEPQPVWLAAAVALAGLTLGLVAWVMRADPLLAVIAACAVWIPWAATRVDSGPDLPGTDLVASQLSLLAPITWPAPIESHTLVFAVLLLFAGLLWRRRGPTPSLQWLGPSVAMALIPSAIATWAAPWAIDVGDLGTTWHLVRLAAVLVASVLAMVIGARLHMGGLLLPASVALAIAAFAQVWSGLSNVPRWVGLGIAGTLLVVAGARIEWLRREGRRAVTWMEGLA